MASFGKAYVPPSVNQVPTSQRINSNLPPGSHPGLGERTGAPNSRESNWDLVKGVQNPFGIGASSREFGFWFNYFWKEAVETPALTPAQQVKVAEAYFSVFRIMPGGARAVRPDFAARDNAFKENVLRQLLLIGFERVAIERPERFEPSDVPLAPGNFGRPPAPMPNVIVDASDLNLTPLKIDGKEWIIGFRCDSRTYEEVYAHLGFNTRARSTNEDLRKSYALDQPWHPYANPVYRNSLFLRRGTTNRDNCLHTVVSVGADFHMTVHFPILNDPLNFELKSPADQQLLCQKPFDEWTKSDIHAAEGHRLKLRVIKNHSANIVDRLEKDNHVHVLYLNGLKGVDTERLISGANAFPERGLESVPRENLLADIKFVQKYWFSERMGKIMLYEVEFAPIRWVPSETAIDKLLGATAKNEIASRIRSEITKAQVRPDICMEGRERDQYLASARTRLTREERLDVMKLLKLYFVGNPTALPTAQKNYVKSQRARLAAKIDAFGMLQWKELAAKAKAMAT